MNLYKKLICCLLALCPFFYADAQSKIFVDFGPNDNTNGKITSNPDVNGNYWNNITNSSSTAPAVNIVDTHNAATGMNITIGTGFATNGIQNGGLLAPSASLLGEFAIPTATEDYFYSGSTGTFKVNGLSAQKKYVFYMFASRQINTETRVTQYNVTGANNSTYSVTSTGAGIGYGGYDGNNNTVVKSDTMYADINGSISISVIKLAGANAYINCMAIGVFPKTNTDSYNFQNPGFETGNLNLWTVDTKDANSIDLVNTDFHHTGAYAVKLGGSPSTLSQKITYIGNAKAYILSGYFYKPSTLTAGQSAYLTLSYYDKNNVLLTSTRSDSITSASPAGSFIKLQANLRVPPGTYYINGAVNWANGANADGSVYFDDLTLEFPLLDALKITYMGSSVSYGQGATNFQGYSYLYSQLLNARKLTGGKDWTTTNISIGGNTTTAVLNRYTSDLIPQKARYVIYALSLGNEGIHENGQPAFDSFNTNMRTLIAKARADGMFPVVTNCYTRNDFVQVDYNYTRQMNAIINSWNVPSVNLLGAVDDLTGKYVNGYWSDALHPNDLGHAEMSYTMVPSLFDALDNGKPLPFKVTGSYISFQKSPTLTKTIDFAPENIVHPFTVAVSFKATAAGVLLQVKDTTGMGTVAIIGGKLAYTSAKGGFITGTTKVDDGNWHKLILTHYYAKGATLMYCDSIAQGSVNEKLITNRVKIGGSAVPQGLQYKNLMFWRSGMNSDEVKNIARDSVLKSSLEIYAPLDGNKASLQDPLANLAQSTNTLAFVDETKNSAIPNSVVSGTGGSSQRNAYINFGTANNSSAYFEIQNSTDGITWTVVSLVAGNGGTSYQALFPNPKNGVNYFRIALYDVYSNQSLSPTFKYNISESSNLTGFTAAGDITKVNLTVSTASEFLADNFYIAKKTDATDWAYMSTITATGTTTAPHTYNSADLSPVAGKNYYVLVYNFNGVRNYSAVQTVDLTPAPGAINLLKNDNVLLTAFPNPTSTNIAFELKNYNGKTIIVTVTSLYGKVFSQETLAVSASRLYTLKSKLPAGTYVVDISAPGLNKVSRVMVK